MSDTPNKVIPILIVEDQPKWSQQFREIADDAQNDLRFPAGFVLQVDHATSYQNAIKKINRNWYKLILLDLHLNPNSEDIDYEGGKQILDQLIKRNDLNYLDDKSNLTNIIVLTTFSDQMQPYFRDYRVRDFIPKEQNNFLNQLLGAIVKFSQNHTQSINYALEIIYPDGFDLLQASRQITFDDTLPGREWISEFKELDDSDVLYARIAVEIDMLFRLMFQNLSKIKVKPFIDGRSSTLVFHVETIPSTDKGDQVGVRQEYIVKLGDGKRVLHEKRNHEKYIEALVGNGNFPSIPGEGRTPLLRGISYNYFGGGGRNIRNFQKFYATVGGVSATANDLVRVINHLYTSTLAEIFALNFEDSLDKSTTDPNTLNLLYYLPTQTLYERLLSLKPDKIDKALAEFAFSNQEVVFERDEIQFPDLPNLRHLPNPIKLFKDLANGRSNIDVDIPETQRRIIHGDVNAGNVTVIQDAQGHYLTGMIDFYRTGLNHVLSDYAQLETVIKFQLLRDTDIKRLVKFEILIMRVHYFTQFTNTQYSPMFPPQYDVDYEIAFKAIQAIRAKADRWVERHQMRDYYISLFYHTINSVKFELSETNKEFDRKKRLYALLSAAIIATKLQP